MPPAASERALAMFEMFLRHARGAGGGPAASAPATRSSPPAPSARAGGPPLPAPRTGRAAAQRASEAFDAEVTRIAQAPSRPTPAADMSSTWDDRTEESRDPSDDEHTDQAVPLPDVPTPVPAPVVSTAPRVFEQSIIIEDDSLTSPEMTREPALSAPYPVAPSFNPLDLLLQEMAVLVKYGHAPQAAQELELWSTAHGDDLSGQLRVAEFEMARVDRERALQRYGALVSLFLDHGNTQAAMDILRRLRRDLPGDPRVTAIAQWNGIQPGTF